MSILGLLGFLRVNGCLMFTHSFLCTSILGAFYVFLILETFLREEAETPSMSDQTVLMLLSVPFLLIFLIGCHAMYTFNLIYEEVKLRRLEVNGAPRKKTFK